MEVVAHQGMVEACPQHFVIADKPLHEKNLKTVKAMPHLQSGPYEYKASIARIKKGFKDQPNSCDTEYQSFKKKNNPYFVYRR